MDVEGGGRVAEWIWQVFRGHLNSGQYKHSSTIGPIAKCKRVARGQWPAGYIYRARSCYGITLALTCVHTPKCDRSIWVRAQYKRSLEAGVISIMYRTPVSTLRNFSLHYKNQAVNAAYWNNLLWKSYQTHQYNIWQILWFFYVKAVVPIVLTAFKGFS